MVVSSQEGKYIKANENATACLFTIGERTYDFSDLAGEYEVNGTHGYKFEIDPCGYLPPDESFCGLSGIHGCQYNMETNSVFKLGDQFYSAGAADGKVTVNYVGGDVCAATGKEREFFIAYRCGLELGFPLFQTEVSCIYFFDWETSLAC